MIVVVGPVPRTARDGTLAGLAAGIARAAVAAGRDVQIVCKVPSGADGDAVVVALGRDGIGHAAMMRDTARSSASDLSAEDLELALRYVTDIAVLVLADPGRPELVKVADDAAAFAGARLVIVAADGDGIAGASSSSDATILQAPARDPDGAFAALVGNYAAALDVGEDPAAAWAVVSSRLGLAPAG